MDIIIILLFAISLIGFFWLKLRIGYGIRTPVHQVNWTRKNVKRKQLVLEVGSGHNPHIRSDVLCDKYFYDDSHRAGKIVFDRPLVIADAEKLPFKKKSFDFIIARHLIEHLDRPELFFREAMRVAKGGFLSVPTQLREQLLSDPQHRWYIKIIDSKLILKQKKEPYFNTAINEFIGKSFCDSERAFNKFMIRFWNKLELIFQWQEEFKFEINKKTDNFDKNKFTFASLDKPNKEIKEPYFKKARKIIQAILVKLAGNILFYHRIPSLEKILMCPDCGGDIKWQEHYILCLKCNRRYPIENKVPIMLIEKSIY